MEAVLADIDTKYGNCLELFLHDALSPFCVLDTYSVLPMNRIRQSKPSVLVGWIGDLLWT